MSLQRAIDNNKCIIISIINYGNINYIQILCNCYILSILIIWQYLKCKNEIHMMQSKKYYSLMILPIFVLMIRMTWHEDSWMLLVCVVKMNFSLNDDDASHLMACVLRVAFKNPFSKKRSLTSTVYSYRIQMTVYYYTF